MIESEAKEQGRRAGVLSEPPRLLDRVTPNHVTPAPFPYLIVPNALDADYYREIEAALPTIDMLSDNDRHCNNRRVDLISSSGRAELSIEQSSNVWQEFLAFHASQAYVNQVISLFADHVPQCSSRLYQEIVEPPWKRSIYDGREASGGQKYSMLKPILSLGKTKWMNNFSQPNTLEVTGRATLALNTPVREQTSVRGPHVDSRHKFYVGLFYLRHPADRSSGGDLVLYRWKAGKSKQRWAANIKDDDVEIIEVIPYRPNSYVLFLNTSDAIHGVSVRSISNVPRYLCVTSGWFASAPARAIGEAMNGEGIGIYAK